MSSISQPASEQPIPAPKRSDTVVMGHQDFVSVLLRSISGELYKLRRRAMPKILLLIAILIMIIAFSYSVLAAGLPPHDTCTVDSHGHEHCIPASQADIQRQKETASAPLRLPNSLSLA